MVLLRRPTLLALLALSAVASQAPRAVAASFDCGKAAKPDEMAVCSTPRLSELDTLLAEAYAQAKKSTDPEDSRHALADTRAFLRRRAQCGSDGPCLLSAYIGVLQDLQMDGSRVPEPTSLSAFDLTATVPPESHALPVHEGECVQTRITGIGGRLDGDTTFASGTSVLFANGGSQVDYDKVPGIIHSHVGDRVLLCLTSIPKHCPPGDGRGRHYITTNLRTRETWSDPDSEHMCGGA